jgi:hypothetical protein
MQRKEINKLANSWTYSKALLVCVTLYLWAEALMASATRVVAGGTPTGASVMMFVLLLPMFWLLVYRWYSCLGFVRSVRVAVVNFCFLALGAMVGVLIQQEDINNPTSVGDVQELVSLGELSTIDDATVSAGARRAYQHFESFREAESFFLYHLGTNTGFRSLLGFEGDRAGDEDQIQEMLSNLESRLPEIAARFGAEKAAAIRSQSETGLRTRAKNGEIRQLEERLNDTLFSLFVIADKLDLRRAYSSDWYSMMWALLFFGVLSSLLRNGVSYLMKKNKWGFCITHGGILLIIIGGLLGRTTEIRGLVNLNIGEHTSEFQTWTRQPKRFVYNPTFADEESKVFAIKLEDFRADQHDVLDIIYVTANEQGQLQHEFDLDEQPKLRVFAGLTQAYDYPIDDLRGDPAFKLEVLEYEPQTTVVRDEDSGAVTSYQAITDATFFDASAATIKLKATGPDENNELHSEEFFLHAAGDGDGVPFSYVGPDGERRVAWLRFREDSDGGSMPLEWQSKLSILEFDEHGHPVKVADGEVRVNDYFIHGGYRFFQTNHNPNDPTYSGIGVVYDLGLPLVLWGLYCVMFATAFVFLVMPLIKGSKTRGQD